MTPARHLAALGAARNAVQAIAGELDAWRDRCVREARRDERRWVLLREGRMG